MSKRRLMGWCTLMFGLTMPLGGQTPKSLPTVTQTEVAARKSPPVGVTPRKERPTLMEALMQKDQRLRTLIKAFDVKEPPSK